MLFRSHKPGLRLEREISRSRSTNTDGSCIPVALNALKRQDQVLRETLGALIIQGGDYSAVNGKFTLFVLLGVISLNISSTSGNSLRFK